MLSHTRDVRMLIGHIWKSGLLFALCAATYDVRTPCRVVPAVGALIMPNYGLIFFHYMCKHTSCFLPLLCILFNS